MSGLITNNLSVVSGAAILVIAILLLAKSRIDFLFFRSGLSQGNYRIGYWIETGPATVAPLGSAISACLQQHGIEAVPLQEQAAADLYRNNRWRDRIGWHAGRIVDVVVVGRLREKPTNDIGTPYAWVLDLRYFYPRSGAQLSAPQLSTFTVVVAGALKGLAAKVADELIKALWLMKTRPAPPVPRFTYETASWPFGLSLDPDRIGRIRRA